MHAGSQAERRLAWIPVNDALNRLAGRMSIAPAGHVIVGCAPTPDGAEPVASTIPAYLALERPQ